MLVVGDTTQAVFVFSESVFLYLHTVPFPVIESNQRQGHGGDISHCLALEGLSSSSSQLTCLPDRFFVQAQQKFSLTWLLFQLWLMFCFRTFLTGFKTNQRQQMSSILSLFMSLLSLFLVQPTLHFLPLCEKPRASEYGFGCRLPWQRQNMYLFCQGGIVMTFPLSTTCRTKAVFLTLLLSLQQRQTHQHVV